MSTEIVQTGYRFPLDESKLFQFHRLEQEAMERVRWLESERLGYDCGPERVEWLWVTTERTKWLREMQASGFLP